MLNFENTGIPIAIISGGSMDKKKVYLAITDEDKEDVKNPLSKITLNKVGGKFETLPNFDIERECGYVCGKSGSGKSTFVSMYLDKYKKKYKNNEIYLFSKINDDDKINKYKPIKIKLDADLLDDDLEPVDFKNSLCIFDDIDTVKDPKVKKEVYNILNSILQEGRHYNVSVLVTNHSPSDREKTKIIFGESHFITYFPHGGSQKQLKYMLESHADLDKKLQKYNKMSKSRWACVKNECPQHVILEKEIYLPGEEEED